MALIHEARSKKPPTTFVRIAAELNRKGMRPTVSEHWNQYMVRASYRMHLIEKSVSNAEMRSRLKHYRTKQLILDLHSKGVRPVFICEALAKGGHLTAKGHVYTMHTLCVRLRYWKKEKTRLKSTQ